MDCKAADSQDFPSILLFGDAETGKKILLECLCKDNSNLISFTTKYYSAKAEMFLAGGKLAKPEPGRMWEAVILNFDISSERSFQYIQKAALSIDMDNVEIKLCVANYANKMNDKLQESRPVWFRAALEWCNENMFECIMVAPNNTKADAQLFLDGELQGIQRLRAALEAHTWPGMTLKAGPTAVTEQGLLCPCTTGEGVTSMEKSLHIRVDGGSRQDLGDSKQNVDALEDESNSSRCDIEDEAERIEALMNDMAGLRRRLQSLPDQDRRSAAESMTMQMISQLGLTEGSDSDVDSD